MADRIKDDSFYIKENDIDAMRRRPTMYIAVLGEAGIKHLGDEIITNSIDETSKSYSPGDTIWVTIDRESIHVVDNGRGIPCDLLQVVHETNQAGSNMERKNGATGGENGTGTTATCAMSSEFIVTTKRPSEKKQLTLIYHEGKLVDKKETAYNGTVGGMDTWFKPSKTVLGSNKVPVERFRTYLKSFDYTLNPKVKLNYDIGGKKGHVQHKMLFEFFEDSNNEIVIPSDARLTGDLSFDFDGELTETYLDKEYKRHFKISVSMIYADPSKYHGEDIRHSWMNLIHTTQNGDHMDGVIKGFSKAIREKITAKNKKYDGQISKKDIESHMSIVVNGSCDAANMFASQAKHTVKQADLLEQISQKCYEKISSMTGGVINEVVDAIIGNHRARVEGEKMRNISSAVRNTNKWEKPDSYFPCATHKTEQPKEIYFVEGLSAAGGLEGGRDASFQAVLAFRGKSLNIWDVDLSRVMKSETWLNAVQVLGCGIGPSFDIKKLKFDKIIIATDADVDGYHIRVGQVSFFIKFMPEIIRAGKLYIAEPPLYQIAKGNDVSYVASQGEYIEACIASLGNLQITFIDKPNVNISVKDFISSTFEYATNIGDISIGRSVNRYLLEFVAMAFAKYGKTVEAFEKNVDKWIKSLNKIYPELEYDHKHHQIKASIDLHDQLILVDNDLISDMSYIINALETYGGFIKFKYKDQSQQTTLLRFFEMADKMYPAIKVRYKGLGSSEAKVSKEIIMNPKTRRLIRVTMDDATIYQTMSMLIGDGSKNKEGRREMLMNYKITKDIIDN